MTRNVTRMARNLAAVYDELPLEAMPSARHRELLLKRRRQAWMDVRLVAPIKSVVPERMMISLRSRKNRWRGALPVEVAEAFPGIADGGAQAGWSREHG